MSKELFVSSTPHETKVAIVEEDQLSEVYYERENEYTLAGSVYKGRVTRVLPGMQSAFVNVGLEPLTLNSSGLAQKPTAALYANVGSNSWAGRITLGRDTIVDVNANTTLNLVGPIGGTGDRGTPSHATIARASASRNTHAAPAAPRKARASRVTAVIALRAIVCGCIVGRGV